MTADPSHLLRITRRFEASPERVFDAWLDPAIARKWLFTSPETDIAARRVEIDARVGGKWLMTNPCEGQEIEGIGECLEIDRPRRLVFTFAIPLFGPHVDRLVVEIVPDGDGCMLTLTHELLPPEFHDPTESGWGKMFNRLAVVLDGKVREQADETCSGASKGAAMSLPHKPPNYNTVSPYLIVDGANGTIDFLVNVFGAVELRRFPDAAGRLMHAEVRIDDTVVMIADGGAGWPPVPSYLHVYVQDVAATYQRALKAVSVQKPVKKQDEDKRGGVKDAGGTTWWIATKVE